MHVKIQKDSQAFFFPLFFCMLAQGYIYPKFTAFLFYFLPIKGDYELVHLNCQELIEKVKGEK